jgi:hypothetical protein
VFRRNAVDEAYSRLDRFIAICAVRGATSPIVLVDTVTLFVPGRRYTRIQVEALGLLLGYELAMTLVILLDH